MKPTRQTAIQEMLDRIEHRQALLRAKCAESLVTESNLTEATASALTERWAGLMAVLKNIDGTDWQGQAVQFGVWCAAQGIPFEAIMAQLHYYKRAAIPLLVREYPGVEGYLEAHLALDEALTLLMGKIPGGYYGHRNCVSSA